MKKIKFNKTFFVPKSSYEVFGYKIYNALVENFPKTFFVGGIIRNIHLKKRVNDIDIATTASPDQVAKVVSSLKLKADLSAKRFGVVALKSGSKEVQVTTFRTEKYSGNRYPEIKFTNSLIKDSLRRDFTLNSLYLQAKENTLYDPADYFSDLKSNRLKAIGNVSTKFIEDPLRIVRAYRFQKEFGLQVEPETDKAIKDLHHLTRSLTKANLKKEIDKATTQKVKNFLTKKFL